MKLLKKSMLLLGVMAAVFTFCLFAAPKSVYAAEETTETAVEEEEAGDDATGDKAIAAGIAIGLAACGGAIGMGMLVKGSTEGIARQPEDEGKIRTTMIMGLAFVETAIIYALIIAILVIFVL